MSKKPKKQVNDNPQETGAKSKKKKKKSPVVTILIILAFIVGLAVLLYPTFSTWWNQRRNASLITEYQQVMTEIDDNTYSQMMADARAYNKQHTVNTFIDVFEGEEGYMLHHPYDQLLNPTGNYIMGYIDIPKINQKLAIGHGTSTETLERGVGHVEGSSLPVGGESTHSVLSAHRGLPSAKLFTDLDQVVVGDKFFIYVLDETLAYQVDQIETVTPDNADFLQIEEGEDLVTLLTCTPYGVNSHRLLVRGHRIPYDPEDITEQARQRTLPERDKPIVYAVIGIIALFIILLIVKLRLNAKDRKRRQAEDQKLIREATETAKLAAQEASKAAKAAEEAKDAAIAAKEATERRTMEQAVDKAVGASQEANEASQAAEDYAKRADAGFRDEMTGVDPENSASGEMMKEAEEANQGYSGSDDNDQSS